jgi:ADP-ribose pyrophosphatase YjhB (NUDIX family)
MKREYPQAPVVAVGVIVRDLGPAGDNRLLVVRRDKEPARGLWAFPGGAVELGEKVRDAAQREAWEETGLEVEVGDVAVVVDHVAYDPEGQVQYHYIIVDFFARPTGGSLKPGTDVSEVKWVGLSDLEALEMTEKAGKIARRLLSELGANGL